jgi:predicted nuclease of predicted toxin-antitoxin system
MKFLADAHISRDMVRLLREQSHDVLWAVDLPPATPDHELLHQASREGRIILTQDKGFGGLIYYSGIRCRGAILLRLIAPNERQRVERLREVLPILLRDQPGYFITVTEHLVRARPI